jgi:hypothetical protein
VPFGSLKWLFLGHVFNQHGISVDPKNVFFLFNMVIICVSWWLQLCRLSEDDGVDQRLIVLWIIIHLLV